MVVCGNGAGLNFEDLAGGRVPRKRYTIPLTFVLLLLSVGLLITIAREKGQTWFIMMVGGHGILQNIVVAGSPRFYLKKRTAFQHSMHHHRSIHANVFGSVKIGTDVAMGSRASNHSPDHVGNLAFRIGKLRSIQASDGS